jgi:hypothetical protein
VCTFVWAKSVEIWPRASILRSDAVKLQIQIRPGMASRSLCFARFNVSHPCAHTNDKCAGCCQIFRPRCALGNNGASNPPPCSCMLKNQRCGPGAPKRAKWPPGTPLMCPRVIHSVYGAPTERGAFISLVLGPCHLILSSFRVHIFVSANVIRGKLAKTERQLPVDTPLSCSGLYMV